MDTLQAFAMGEANRDKEQMVFDWNKAARLIVNSGLKDASAGLAGDWEYTGGDIFLDGKIVNKEDTYTFLASTWATPQIVVGGKTYECYKMQFELPDWNAETYWPESARNILADNKQD